MNILFITTHFPPLNSSASIRNMSLVNGLSELGNRVTVYSLDWPDDAVNFDGTISCFLDPGVRVERGPVGSMFARCYGRKGKEKRALVKSNWIFRTKAVLKRGLRDFIFFPDVFCEWTKKTSSILSINERANWIDDHFDLIVSSSDSKTSHFVARNIVEHKLKNNIRIPWYQIWGDPWCEDISESFITRIRAKRHERKLIEGADRIYYVSRPTMDRMRYLFPHLKDRIKWIGRGFVGKIEGSSALHEGNEVVLAYVGTITLKRRNILPLIRAMEKLAVNGGPKYVLDIWGRCDQATRNIIAEHGNVVRLRGFANFEEVQNIYRDADILLFVGNKDSHQIPGKLFDYFGTNRPILTVVESLENPVAKFIEESQRCVMCLNSDDSISEALAEITSMEAMWNSLDEYSPRSIAARLLL